LQRSPVHAFTEGLEHDARGSRVGGGGTPMPMPARAKRVCSSVQPFPGRDDADREPFFPQRVLLIERDDEQLASSADTAGQTSSGEGYEVRHPEMAFPTRTEMVIASPDRQGVPCRARIVANLHITALEPIEAAV
jgi:hypothetical protein